ncbi:hypothetical protein BVX94_02010 [bacterium B17]|nr:hypothetical protein BVX94_02010 [bacterium B17]
METKRELDTNDKLLRITAVAEVLDISVRQVWRLIASEDLPRPVRIGRSVKKHKGQTINAGSGLRRIPQSEFA